MEPQKCNQDRDSMLYVRRPPRARLVPGSDALRRGGKAGPPRYPDGARRDLQDLKARRDQHALWRNPLLAACAGGVLDKQDFRLLFSQYYLYARSFTRYLAAFMANCEDDGHRARLSANLWEEGGMLASDKRHSELLRHFLRTSLDIEPDEIEYSESGRHFARAYLDFCMRSSPRLSSAFLALGTEGIVGRLYGILVRGLVQAGINDDELTFFHLHMECDDEHAASLEDIMLSYAYTPDWSDVCLDAMNHALDLRDRFFTSIYRKIERRHTGTVFAGTDNCRALVIPMNADQ
ncbi:MAG: iron-containing redox enzyme family protein [Proteobacteria bacterium]|nr:iron-containing redox enzyme family protein [Pseudomonadota bacterium]